MKTARQNLKNCVCNIGGRLALAVALAGLSTAAQATDYSEGLSGDLSSNPATPTFIGSLTAGNNYIVGATVPSGPVIDPTTGARAVEDDDYVSFTVPTGSVLSNLLIDSDTLIDKGDRIFFGIASGSSVDVPSGALPASGLLGWTLIGQPEVGTDVLSALGKSAPADFPSVPGATTFSGPLGAGTYSLWLVDGDNPVSYSLDLKVSAVPEPASWAMMIGGIGLMGGVLRRRARMVQVRSVRN